MGEGILYLTDKYLDMSLDMKEQKNNKEWRITNLIECTMMLLTQIIYFTLHDENSQIFGQKPPRATNNIQQN